jgi:hypothetical protein
MGILGAMLMVPPRRFYTVCLPVVWGITSLVNFHYPGDEYGLWGLGSLAGLWMLWPVSWFRSSGAAIEAVPPVVGAGVITMAALGWMMDKFRCPLLPFLAVWFASTATLVHYALAEFPSYERAMMKNGSLWAYLLSSLNLCLLAVTVAMIAALAVWRIAKSRLAPASVGAVTQ